MGGISNAKFSELEIYRTISKYWKYLEIELIF